MKFALFNFVGFCVLLLQARLDILLVREIDGLKDAQRIPYEDIEFEVLILANPKPQVVW
jgi:hypothetical protein